MAPQPCEIPVDSDSLEWNRHFREFRDSIANLIALQERKACGECAGLRIDELLRQAEHQKRRAKDALLHYMRNHAT
jgi:hypothetical protein